jgi:hypothetical protein
MEVWAFFSPNVADHPLRPTKDLWLVSLLHLQLPNPSKAFPVANKSFYIANYILYSIYINITIFCPVLQFKFFYLLTRTPLNINILRSTCMCKAYH